MNPIVFAMKHPITTLMLVVALVSGGKAYRSPSMYPDDPDSVYHDPHVHDRPGGHDEHIRAAEGCQAPPLAAT